MRNLSSQLIPDLECRERRKNEDDQGWAAAFRVLVAEIKVRGWRGGWWINNILVI